MTKKNIAKSVFEFVRELDKKYCARTATLFNDCAWESLTLRQRNSLDAIVKWHKKEMARRNTKVVKATAPNSAIVQLLSDCQDVICHSVYLDDNGHSALMDRINAIVAQQHQ